MAQANMSRTALLDESDMPSFSRRANLSLFADGLVLQTLCASDTLDAFRTLTGFDQRDEGAQINLIRGYSFTVTTPLYGLLHNIICYPELIATEPDERLLDAWFSQPDEKTIASRAAFTDPTSALAKVAVSVRQAMNHLRKADTWHSLVEAISAAEYLGQPFQALVSNCVALPLKNNTTSIPDAETLVYHGAIERLMDYWEYERTFRMTHAFLWNTSDFWKEIVNDSLDVQTHLDHFQVVPSGRHIPQPWLESIFVLLYIAFRTLSHGKESSIVIPPYKSISGAIKQLMQEMLEVFGSTFNLPSMTYELELSSIPLSGYLIREEGTVSPIRPIDRLKALLGNEDRLLASSDSLGVSDFHLLVAGVLSGASEEQQCEVVRIRHLATDSLTWYSLAVRVPRFGYFSNFSKWWVFYKVYVEGNWLDNEDVRAREAVEHIVSGERINLIELQHIAEEDLLDLCEPAAWKSLLGYAKEMKDINSTLRGVLPELLASMLLIDKGYTNIRTSFRPRGLSNRELDVIGVKPSAKGGQCLVLETKGKSTTDRELKEALSKFSDKIVALNQQKESLASEIEYDGAIYDVSGVFISMGILDGFEHTESQVEFWDYRRFVDELKRSRFSKRYVELLELTVVAVEITLEDFASSWLRMSGDL